MFPRIDAPYLHRHHPECATPRKPAFVKRLADVLIQHTGWFGLVQLAERTDCLSFPCILRTCEVTHIALLITSRTRTNQAPGMYSYKQSIALIYFLADMLIFLCCGLQHENRYKNYGGFHEPHKKRILASSVQRPLPRPRRNIYVKHHCYDIRYVTRDVPTLIFYDSLVGEEDIFFYSCTVEFSGISCSEYLFTEATPPTLYLDTGYRVSGVKRKCQPFPEILGRSTYVPMA